MEAAERNLKLSLCMELTLQLPPLGLGDVLFSPLLQLSQEEALENSAAHMLTKPVGQMVLGYRRAWELLLKALL